MCERFLYGLGARAGAVLVAGALLGVSGCSEQPGEAGSVGQVEGARVVRQAALPGEFSAPAVYVAVVEPSGVVAVSDIVQAVDAADPDSFSLVGATTLHGHGIAVNSSGDELNYSGNPSQGWDRFEYEICEEDAPTHCEVGVVHLVIKPGICAGLELEESFSGADVEGSWVFGGDGYTANLTAAGPSPVDQPGEGWLRLSPLTARYNGYGFFDEKFPASNGVSMSFETTSWGTTSGNGGDGLLFFLVDGDEVDQGNFETGGCCGSLGYAPYERTGSDPVTTDGMPHAVAGIAFDAWGGHWAGKEGRTGPDVTPPGGANNSQIPNNITVRGGVDQNWKTLFVEQLDTNILEMTCDGAGCDSRPDELGAGRYQATVTLTPKDNNSHFLMEVYVKTAPGSPYVQVAAADIPQSLPVHLKLGFVGASGGSLLAYHEIRGLKVNPITDAKMEASASIPDGQMVINGQEVTYTYTISNHTSGPICAANVKLSLPQGFEITDQSCQTTKSGDFCGALGSEGVLEDTIALDGDGELVVTITGTVRHGSNTPSADASGEVEPTGPQQDSNPADNSSGHTHEFAEPTLADRTITVTAGRSESFDVHDDVLGGDNVDYDSVDMDLSNLPQGVTVDYDPATGEVTVAVERDYSGPDIVEVSYTIDNDQGTSPPATITIEILDAMHASVGGSSDNEVWVETGTPSVEIEIEGSEPIGSVTLPGAPTPSGDASVADKTVTFTPDAGKEDETGSYIIEVEVCAQADPTNCETIEVTVVYNDPPTIDLPAGDNATAPKGRTSALPFDVDAGDIGDIDPDSIEITGGAGEGCALSGAGDAVEFTPDDAMAAGTTVVCTVQVCEERPEDLCASQDFIFTIVDTFHPTDDVISGGQGERSEVAVSDLLANDGNADPASFELVGNAQGGSVSEQNGEVVFEADDGATSGSFEYKVCAAYDATECEVVTVSVDIAEKPAGLAPTVWVLEEATPAEVAVNSPFDEPTDNSVVDVQGGSATVGPDGKILVTPDPGHLGPVTVEVKGCTQTPVPACETTIVTVIVNDLPTMAGGDAIVTPGGTQQISSGADPGQVGTINQSSIELVSSADTPNGTCGVDTDTGKVTFEADPNATLSAVETCTIKICELAPAGACVEADFTFEVQDIFNPTDDDFKTIEGEDKEIETDRLINNDGNADPDSFSIVGTSDADGNYETAEGGVLTPNGDETGLIYTPPADFTGEDSFSYEICSGLDAGECEEVTVIVKVEAKVRIESPVDGDLVEDLTPTVTGTGEPNTEVTITVDGDETYLVIVDEDGKWSWTPEDELSPGEHTIEAEGDNGSSAEITVTLEDPDAEHAPVKIIDPTGGATIEDTRPTISGTGEPGATITVSVDGEVVDTLVVDEDGEWSWTPDFDLEDGAHVVEVEDEFGQDDSVEFTIGDEEESDAGGQPDAGESDAGQEPDAGESDAGQEPDAGESDAGDEADAGGESDTGFGPDTGAGADDELEGTLTGGRAFGCAAGGQHTPPVGFALAALVGAALCLRRRRV